MINYKYDEKVYNKKNEIAKKIKYIENKDNKGKLIKEDINTYSNILEIDKINLYLNVIKASDDYSNLDNNLVYYKTFNVSNKIIIFGHSGLGYGSYFNRIDELKKGDLANIYVNSNCYNYHLYRKYYINEDETDILNEEINANKLLLITCKKHDNTKRLVLEFHKIT